MKTTIILPVLCSALIFCAVNSASSGNIGKKDGQISLTTMVKHHVNVNLVTDKKLCNVYLVEILKENGQLAAPAKTFIPGVSSYDFYERGPASGMRIAVLVLAPVYSHFSCDTELFTAPAIMNGPFMAGETYRYDLFPQTQPSKD